MLGTEKQIAWAEKIKAEKIAHIEKMISQIAAPECPGRKDMPDEIEFHENSKKAKEVIGNIEDGPWWIDHRDVNICQKIVTNFRKNRDPLFGI